MDANPRSARQRPSRFVAGVALALAFAPAPALAAGSSEIAQSFLWFAILLVAAKLGTLVERIGQPAVLGEILVGIVLGNLTLVGIGYLAAVPGDSVIKFLAELGAVILLFQLGLETSIQSMRQVGGRAVGVALIGVAVPFVLGTYIVGPVLLPGMSPAAYLFLGAALTATSVGITGRVFRDMGCLGRPEAQIVLGAAVIDDVLGLIILAVVSSIAASGAVSAGQVALISAQAVGFLVAALLAGRYVAPHAIRLFARIHSGHDMQLAFALGLCLTFAWLAHRMGLAPIVGAFAAGLILDQAHLRHFDDPAIKREMNEALAGADAPTRDRAALVVERHAGHHLSHMVEPVGHFLVPLFFVMAGMHVKVESFSDPKIVAVAAALTVVAIAGKIVAGLAAGDNVNRWVIGWGMVPRGEVGLIFAFVGKSLGVVTDAAFSVIVIMVVLTTLLTPPILNHLLRDRQREGLARHTRIA